MKKKLKNILLNFTLFCISMLVAAVIAEGIIRVLYKDKMVLFPRYHTDAEYEDYTIRRTRPDMEFVHRSVDGNFHFKTNNKGFRGDQDLDYPKQSDELRVLCIGDSHTFGYEVNQEETFASVVESTLQAKGINATAINAGVSGFSTSEELVLLENEGLKYKPDYVVLGFFNNDFSDNLRSDLFKLENDQLAVNAKEYLPGVDIQNKIYSFGIIHFLGENSYLYNYVFNAVWDFYKNMSAKKAEGEVEVTEYAIETREEFSPYEIDLMKALISRMCESSGEQDASLIIVDIPQFEMTSSIPDVLVDHFRMYSDTLFYTNELLPDYSQLTKTHVPHGHRHISAESHKLLGEKIADLISTDLEEEVTETILPSTSAITE